MQATHTTRRQRLAILKNRFGSYAKLNDALGWPTTDAKLNRIANQVPRTDRPGKIFNMGDKLARDVEQLLSLPAGWMDTPLTYSEIHGDESPRTKALAVFEALPDEQVDTALRLLAALAESKKSTGTSG